MVKDSAFWNEYSELFDCPVEELHKFSIDFFSAENVMKAAEVMDNFIDSHPVKDIDKLNDLLSRKVNT